MWNPSACSAMPERFPQHQLLLRVLQQGCVQYIWTLVERACNILSDWQHANGPILTFIFVAPFTDFSNELAIGLYFSSRDLGICYVVDTVAGSWSLGNSHYVIKVKLCPIFQMQYNATTQIIKRVAVRWWMRMKLHCAIFSLIRDGYLVAFD